MNNTERKSRYHNKKFTLGLVVGGVLFCEWAFSYAHRKVEEKPNEMPYSVREEHGHLFDYKNQPIEAIEKYR